MKKINILGIGPGSRDYLLKITEKEILESDVLIGGERALSLFSDLDKKTLKITADLEFIKNYILKNYQEEKISVLVSGDPGFFSIMNYLKRHISNELLNIIPGISSLQLAAARLKMNWNDMTIISLHGKEVEVGFINKIKSNSKIGLFTDDKFSPDQIASFLLKKGIANKKAVVFEKLSYPDEKIIKGSLKKIKDDDFAKLTVMVILDEEMEI